MQIEEFLRAKCSDEINRLGAHYPKKRSIIVDFKELETESSELADQLISNPSDTLEQFEAAVVGMDIAFSNKTDEERQRINVRFTNLPPDVSARIKDCTSTRLGKFISVDGVVTKSVDVLPKVWRAVFKCKRCGRETEMIQKKLAMSEPPFCESCNRREFELLTHKSHFIDYQKIEVQEPLEMLKGGEQARRISVWLENDLTGLVLPGQKILINGILKLQPPKGNMTVYQKFLDANNIEFTEQEFEELELTPEETEKILQMAKDPKVYEKIISSIAPSIYGHTEAKEAIMLQLFSGSPDKVLPDGMRIRSNIHVLLIGDPGCLVADERVVLGNGTIAKIGEIGKEHLEEINTPLLTGQGYTRDIATVFHTYKNQPIMEIVTETGKSIRGTYNHPLLVVEGRERCWKRLDEINVGDRVATVPWIPCTITAHVKTGWKKEKRRYGPKSKSTLPDTVDEPLAGLMGYVLGDGWVREYRTNMLVNCDEADLVPHLVSTIEKKFGVKPRIRHQKPRKERKKELTEIEINDVDISRNLLFLRDKRVPDLIFKSGNNVVAEFISWLFEADGCVFSKGRGRRAIQLKSSSIELLRDMQILLLRFAIHSRIIGGNLVIRRANSIKKFANSIGFQSHKKRKLLQKLVEDCQHLREQNLRGKQLSEKVVKVSSSGYADVFDVEVPKSHRFIANGVISHNTAKSQMLKYVDRLAPKSLYVSGKSSSGAGLTASAEKDEFGEGGWVLKAGALVIASGGLAAIDEFDKMSIEDRSAIHEALEQQTVSVAKAGIIATFKAESSVLAAANPKYSRFDPYKPPSEQFDIPPTILSRFDLIFPIKDVLDEQTDRKLAQHILGAHKLSQLKGKKGSEEGEEERKSLVPQIDGDTLRKYIAYARKNVVPILTDESINRLRDYYVDLRKKGSEGTVPLTPRQLEALVRLSEASAKVRMSNKVELQDSERAIRLVEFVLFAVGMDEKGGFDIDRIMADHPKSERDRIYSILQIVKNLEGELDQVPRDKVLEEAKEYYNIDKTAAENIIHELINKGDLYEPRYGVLKTVSK